MRLAKELAETEERLNTLISAVQDHCEQLREYLKDPYDRELPDVRDLEDRIKEARNEVSNP